MRPTARDDRGLVSCPKQIGPRSVWEKQATIKTLVGRFTQRLGTKRCDRTTRLAQRADALGEHQEGGGIVRPAVEQHFVVQMRRGAAAARAERPDGRMALN